MSLRDDILAKKDLKTVKVEIPEWEGLTVYVRMLSGADRDKIEEITLVSPKTNQLNYVNFRSRLAAVMACDENGNRIFSDADIVELGKKSGRALERIVMAGNELNGITQKDVDDLEKKSVTDPSAASGSV